MPSAHGAHIKYAWQRQPDAVLSQPNPVQNVWYPVLVAAEDVRIITIGAVISAFNETVEGRIIGDGITRAIGPAAFVAGTAMEASQFNALADPYYWSALTLYSPFRSFLDEGQSISVDIRITTAGGGTPLDCRVKWARLLPT